MSPRPPAWPRPTGRTWFGALLCVTVLALPGVAFADFCSGKQNGLWCDGSKLVNCQGGSVSSSQNCPNGCQSMPVGTPDKCKSSSGFCSGKQNGLWCDGDKLVNCQNGNVASSQTCPNGCQSMPVGTPDTCKESTNFCSGKASGYWCDGNNLVLCKSGSVSSSQGCPNGCQSNPAGTDDVCKSSAGTGFCAGKQNGLWCDGDKLVNCQGGSVASSQTCANGCASMPAGVADQCKSGGTVGFCVGKQSGLWCDGDQLVNCQGGDVASTTTCNKGCASMPLGVPDQCKPDDDGGGGTGEGGTGGKLELCNPFQPAKAPTCGFGCYGGHKGSDYACADGTPLFAPTSGTVTKVVNSYNGQTCSPDFGNLVKIATGPYEIILGHMRKDVLVSPGKVNAGKAIGYASNTGYTMTLKNGAWVCQQGGGHHLHLEVRKNGVAFDAYNSSEVVWKSCGEIGGGDGGGGQPAGFCSGKQNGLWCDGSKLVNCQGGNVASSNDCPNGCQSMPVGVPDACKAEAPPPSPCAGKDNASICAGDGVLLCVGGQVQQSITCTEGCVESGGAANCQQPPPPDPCNGTPSGPSCEGDVLRQCKDGKTASATPCAFGCGDLGGALGCLPDPATVDPCTDLADGGHCAAKGDDASVLRTCAAGKTIALQVCGFGCASVGGKDGCAQPGGGGACAATPDGTRCDGTKLLTCQGGAVVDQQLCAFGCAVFAGKAGCLSVEGAACADAGDGPACQGQLLLGCAAGQVQSATLCTEGCEASGGAHCSAASGFCADKVDAAWCSGGKLVHCLAQFEAGVEVCKYGCHPQPGATPDTCAAAKSSVCGGQTDGSYCDGPARVGCQGGLEVGRVACALGCGGVPGQASCEAAEAVACVGKDDGTHCIGSAVVACASGEAALVTPCVNGCAVDSAFGPSCVQASQTAAALGVAVDAAGCASLQGDFVLSTVAHQSQLGEDAQLGTCPDRTVQSHGAFVGALSMVYATLGAPRTVLGVSGNTPALENAWRTQHDGYGDCGAPGVCCPRWDRDPEPIGFDLSAPLPTCLPSQVVARIATSLVAGRPVVAEVRAPGGVGAGRFVALVGVDKVAGWLVLDSAATAEVRPLSSVLAGGAELARVALPRLDGEGLHDLDGKPIADGGVAPLVDADPVDGGGSTDVGDAGGAPEVFGDGGGLDLGTGAGIPRAEPSGCSAGRDRPVPTIAWLLLAALIVIGSRRRRRSA